MRSRAVKLREYDSPLSDSDMPRRSKGKRFELTVRVDPELRDELQRIATLHGRYLQDELEEMLRRERRLHDPKTCANERCAELRKENGET